VRVRDLHLFRAVTVQVRHAARVLAVSGEKLKRLLTQSKCVCAQSVNKISMQNLKDTRTFVNEVETQYE